MLNRVGEFFISDELLHDNPEIVQKIMGEVVVVSCIHNYGYGRFEYIAFSNHFKQVERGMKAPLYKIALLPGAATPITFSEIERVS